MPRGVKGSGKTKTQPAGAARTFTPEVRLKRIEKKIDSLSALIESLHQERNAILAEQRDAMKAEILKKMTDVGLKPEDFLQ